MRKPVEITTPYPNLDDLARFLGISPRTRRELDALADRLLAEQEAEDKRQASKLRQVENKPQAKRIAKPKK